jgi:hypothetical protein
MQAHVAPALLLNHLRRGGQHDANGSRRAKLATNAPTPAAQHSTTVEHTRMP